MLAPLPRRSLGRGISRHWTLRRTIRPNVPPLVSPTRPPRRAAVRHATTRWISTSSIRRQDDDTPVDDPEASPLADLALNDPSWKLRVEQKSAFVAPALEAARRGTPPPWPTAQRHQRVRTPKTPRSDPAAFTSAPDASLFAFVRTRLLRIAEAELEEESWVKGDIDTVPRGSRMASASFSKAIEDYLRRGDYWPAAVLLEDWLRFLPLSKFRRKRDRRRVRASELCWQCIQGFDIRVREDDEATCQAWASRIKELHYASDEAGVQWNSEATKRAALLFARTGNGQLCLGLLSRHLELNYWPSRHSRLAINNVAGKSTEDDNTHSADVAVAMFLVEQTGTFLAEQSQVLVEETDAGDKESGDVENHIARVHKHFASLAQVAELLSTGKLPQFQDPLRPNAHMHDPYLGCVREMCRAKELLQNLTASSSSSAYGDALEGNVLPLVDEIEKSLELLIRTVFAEDRPKIGNPYSPRAQRIIALRKARPVPKICIALLRFCLRNLTSPELAACIMSYMIKLAKESVPEDRTVEEDTELAPDTDGSEDLPLTPQSSRAPHAEATHLTLRSAHTMLLNEAVRLREREMELAALQIIMCEEMGSGWLEERRSRTWSGGHDAGDALEFTITAQDHAYLLQSSVSERDFSRTCALLRFLTVNALVLSKKEMESLQASMQSGKRMDPLIRSHSNLARFESLPIGPIQGMAILRLFFPSIFARIRTQRTGALAMHHAYTTKELDILQHATLCTHILNALVKGSCWEGVEAVWAAIYNTATARSTRGHRTISVQEATLMMQYLEATMNETMRSLRRHAGQGDDSGVGECMDVILAGRSRVRDEYHKVKEHWQTLTRTGSGNATGIRPDARYFRSVLSASAWPAVLRVLGEQAPIDQEASPTAETSSLPAEYQAQSYFEANVKASSTEESSHAKSHSAYTQARLSLLEDGDSVAFLMEVLTDMQVRRIPIPAAYTQDLLPHLGLAESTIDARLEEDVDTLRKNVKRFIEVAKQKASAARMREDDTADSDAEAANEELKTRVARLESPRFHILLEKDRGLHRSPWRQRVLDRAKNALGYGDSSGQKKG